MTRGTNKGPSTAIPKTLARIGVTPPDTEFNRRAAAYAKRAVRLEYALKHAKAYYARKKAAKL